MGEHDTSTSEGRGPAEVRGALGQSKVDCGDCDQTLSGPYIRSEARYTKWGTFWLIFGVTARPTHIDYVCAKCKKTVHTTRDPADVKAETF